MGDRARVVALAAAATLSISAVQATEVRYPAAKPRISLIVPNDWKIDETPLGLELQSPEKDSLVIAALTSADRKTIDGWAQRALERMRSQGVVFAKTGQATTAAERAAGSTPGQPHAGKTKRADATSATGATNFASTNGGRPYTFGGAPTIGPPPIESDQRETAARAGGVDLPTVPDLATGLDTGTMKPAGHFLYTGGSLRGQPVDVELTLFPVGKNERLLFEQQSGPIDARGVKIMHSLRDLTQ